MRRPKRVENGDGDGVSDGSGGGGDGGGGGGDVGSGRSGATGMRSIPIDNRIYGGKLAREGDGIGDARVRGNLEEMEASTVAANPQTLFSPRRSSSPSSFSSLLRSSIQFSLSFLFHPLSLFFPVSSVSLIPISTFSSHPCALFRRLNQPAEEMTRRGGRTVEKEEETGGGTEEEGQRKRGRGNERLMNTSMEYSVTSTYT